MTTVIAHSGVKGMKWGVRKRTVTHPRSKTGTPKKDIKKHAISPHKKVSEMSDTELQDKINRLTKERMYRDLTTTTKKTSVGKRIMANILEESIKDVGKQATKYMLSEAINKISGKKVIDPNSKKK